MLPSSKPHLTTANHINVSVNVIPSIRKTNFTKNYAMATITENNKYFDACRKTDASNFIILHAAVAGFFLEITLAYKSYFPSFHHPH